MTAVEHAELKRLAECLHGPHEWGYRDPVEGGFIEDDRPYRASEALYALLSEIEGLKAERDEARAGRSIIAGGSMDMAVMYASANERAADALDALRTQAPDSWRPDREAIKAALGCIRPRMVTGWRGEMVMGLGMEGLDQATDRILALTRTSTNSGCEPPQ